MDAWNLPFAGVVAITIMRRSQRAAALERRRRAAAARTAGAEQARRALPAAYASGAIPERVLRDAARIAVASRWVSPFDLTRQIGVPDGNGRLGITAARQALAELERRGIVGGENRDGRRAALFGQDAWVDVLYALRGDRLRPALAPQPQDARPRVAPRRV